ncbi:unnamed protein product [Caenorhabditis bovis]|uniref:SXP/RAL-2 family protein Ani s 5-like cation-binding domain-containing protein n=1 Tax=Caenorhabditis bovis TaxID=2654633 RepID=A0A8S1EMD5_9PELO|nr:unnamed protein product [Caenorhabditis bovis]
MQRNFLLATALLSCTTQAYYFKRSPYGDAPDNVPDYINSYYGFPVFSSNEPRRRQPANFYPSQSSLIVDFNRNPFDFGPAAHRFGDANEKTDRERIMENAKPGFWRKNSRETMDRIKKILNEKRSDLEQKHVQIRRIIVNEGAEIRAKFADLHKRLIQKNNKMFSTTSTPINEIPRLSKQAQKLEKQAKKIMENEKMPIEKKQEMLDKLMLKAPDAVKSELNAINDDKNVSPQSTQPQYKPQQSFSIVEARPIRVSEDGNVIEI